jgi:hypothetical protein
MAILVFARLVAKEISCLVRFGTCTLFRRCSSCVSENREVEIVKNAKDLVILSAEHQIMKTDIAVKTHRKL